MNRSCRRPTLRTVSAPAAAATALFMLAAGCTVRFGGSNADGSIPPGCGNGVLEPGEVCDGTDFGGQTCQSAVGHQDGFLECNEYCQLDLRNCHTCGDGEIDGPELCDDGNLAEGDGCSDRCAMEPGWVCVDEPSVCNFTCGNNELDEGEQCDDGNIANGDGCSPSCQVEPGWTCTTEPTVCTPICGDGLLRGSEGCDDGNTVPADGCGADCQVETGWFCAGEPSNCIPACGDGLVVADEGCDDQNNNDGDGCSGVCQVEPGWQCSGQPSVCVTVCGDGVIAGQETCDDGNANAGDGCSGICQIEDYHACDGQPSVCVCAVFVDIDPLITQRDGRSWFRAYDNVQSGIDTAYNQGQGCEVWVAEGRYHIYRFGNADRVEMRSNVGVYGGFAGTETARTQRNWVNHETILDGSQATVPTNRTRTVVRATNADGAALDGFTVTNGLNTAGNGGGLRIESNNVTVANCVFTGNEAEAGGGVYARNGPITITDCTFQSNTAQQTGGGLLFENGSLVLQGSTFVQNTAGQDGGGMYNGDGTVTISGCTFQQNTAQGYGGGLYFRNGSGAIQGCTFQQNAAQTSSGGGISMENTSPTVDGCVFINNTANTAGGGMRLAGSGCQPIVQNSIFALNTAASAGGGAVNTYMGADATIANCTFYENTTNTNGGAAIRNASAQVTVVNCIVRGTETNQIFNSAGTVTVSRCNISGGYSGGTYIIDADPLFVDVNNLNFRLLFGSPCIDVADGDQAPTLDADGNSRVDDPNTTNDGIGNPPYADMGAYEYQP